MQYIILPLRYNSYCIKFTEWVILFTLCLAPLIAHVISGNPQIAYLTKSRPKWYDHLCHYNPTSILWRYAVITDRRLRALDWNNLDMAASNAKFWTDKGWDGSEQIVVSSALHCTRKPESSSIGLISPTTLKTLITTLQGIAAIYSLVEIVARSSSSFSPHIGVDSIFFPLAVLGLLRLCAAIWLTEDFAYTLRTDIQTESLPFIPTIVNGRKFQMVDLEDDLNYLSPSIEPKHRFKPTSCWPCWIFRLFYLLVLLGVWAISFIYLAGVHVSGSQRLITMTCFLIAIFYLIIATVSIIVYTYYFARGLTTTTILPSISSTWYRLYTVFITAFAFAIIIIASIETNKHPGGYYSSIPFKSESGNCYPIGHWFTVGASNAEFFGLATTINSRTLEESSETWMPVYEKNVFREQFSVFNFSGYCVGSPR